MTKWTKLIGTTSRLALFTSVLAMSFVFSLSTTAWSQDHDGHDHDEAEEQVEEPDGHTDRVELSVHDIERMGIVVSAAGEGTIRKTLRLPGEIVLNEDRVAHIVPRFDGIVQNVRKRLGDKVSAGEVMAVIESNTSLQVYKVKSLIAGTVVQKHITLGEFVSTNSDVYVVADLSDVWVIISVYARDQGSVLTGQRVTIRSNDLNLGDSATISYVSQLVDEHTRTSPARAVIDNAHGRWRPGSFVSADLLLDEIHVSVAVPNHAIEFYEGHEVVFVQDGDGFVPREVTIGASDGQTSEIISGLAAGDLIVMQGSFTLKAELMKGSFGDDHGH
jgi:cobalt-zinc-cadmium efflux system membrane fusion protein